VPKDLDVAPDRGYVAFMTNEATLRECFLRQMPVRTPVGVGTISRWERYYPLLGDLTDFVDEIVVVLGSNGATYETSDLNELEPV
jgi:hypothetical protein